MMKHFLCVLIVAAAVCGCGSRPHSKNPGPTRPPQETLAEEMRARISLQVLRGIPETGRLTQVRSRGILKVALPPARKPFQSRDPANPGLPLGFNADLADEIAGVLLVKTDMRILSENEIEAAASRCASGTYDVVFLPPGVKPGRGATATPYFFESPGAWHTLCAAGPHDSLRRAVGSILSYLNESGVLTQMYTSHFGSAAPAALGTRKKTHP
jgi:ABC-type amino acid transport substrate-binding protein